MHSRCVGLGLAVLGAGLLVVLCIGCASIVGETSQNIGISSQPKKASVTITDEDGKTVYDGTTPATVNLEKSKGFFKGQSYMIRIAKEGYEPQTIQVTAHPNGWYVAGNFVFGGLIGWFIVDPATGAMWTLSPEDVTAVLHGPDEKGDAVSSVDTRLKVTLLADVPAQLRSKMEAVRE